MCGRTRLSVPPSDLADVFDAAPMLPANAEDALNLNCAPTDPILVVRKARDADHRELALMRWGLVPFFVDDIRDAKPLINARVETVATSRAFRDSFKKRRCLVIADGFYEWHDKRPNVINRPDGAPFAMAGIWDRWSPHGKREERIETCAIITRSSKATAVETVHDRMPVALERTDYAAWLDPATDPEALREILMRPVRNWVLAPVEKMPASSRVKTKKQLVLF